MPRVLRAYVLYVLLSLCALVPYVPRALRALLPCMSHVICVLVSHVPRANVPHTLHVIVPHLPLSIRAFKSHVFRNSCVLCSIRPHVSRFMSPFSLRTLLSCTLRTLCPNIIFCALLMKNQKNYLDG